MLKEGGQSKYFFIGILSLVAIISAIVVLPLLTSVITGAILAFLFHPIYTRIQKRLGMKRLSAFLTTALILLLVTVPVIFLINNLTQETHYLYLKAKQQILSREFIETRCYDGTFLCRSINRINDILEDEDIKKYLLDRLNEVLQFITQKISNLIFSLPSVILSLLVVLFTVYYCLKDGGDFLKRATKVAPLKVHHQEEITKQFSDVTKAIIYGSFVVALVQGTLGAFGLWIFGIKSFLWWGVIMTFFALIPFIGTWVVWFPASIYLGLTGYLQGETGLLWRGIGLFFYGLLIISTADNILKPIIVAGRAKIHPLLILIGILGGLFVFGLIGLIIGPLILALLQTLLQIYEREREPHIGEPEKCIMGNDGKHSMKHKKGEKCNAD